MPRREVSYAYLTEAPYLILSYLILSYRIAWKAESSPLSYRMESRCIAAPLSQAFFPYQVKPSHLSLQIGK